MSQILLVEDEKVILEAFNILLKAQGYTVDCAANGQEALKLCRNNQYDLILLDLMMPVLDGVGFLEQAELPIKAPNTRVVILSNLSSGKEIVQALSLGAHRHEIKSNLSTKDMINMVNNELAVAK